MLPHYFNTKCDLTQAFPRQNRRKSFNFPKKYTKYFGGGGKNRKKVRRKALKGVEG
jgi:hypothetical protein